MNISKGDKHVVVEFKCEKLTQADIEKAQDRVSEKYENESIILRMANVADIEEKVFEMLSFWNETVKGRNKSFVIAELVEQLGTEVPEIEKTLTMSEAQDIIYMEEVERDIDEHLGENF